MGGGGGVKKDRKIQKWRIHSLRVGGCENKKMENTWFTGGWENRENRKNGEYIVYMCVVNPENYS